jgi:hypothetical protein
VRTCYLGPERRAGRPLVRTLDQVVGWVFSLSYSSPAQPDGRFAETISTEAIIATRP